MLIGINATAAFKKPRTGVEEYTYQLIKHLTMLEESKRHRFILYSHQPGTISQQSFSDNFKIKQLKWFLPMWTQIRLAGQLAINKPDVLFIPVHILPLIHPKNSVVTIHGLEYEYYPQMYPWQHLRYLRWSTKYALRSAKKIIAVSENTKRDLIDLYGGEPDTIEVIYHGIEIPKIPSKESQLTKPYILFLGRLETKKNFQGLIKAFALLKKKYRVPHQLILVGPRGYGFEKSSQKDVVFTDYVPEEEKWRLLKQAEMFVLPSFYEGFGMPILEAQAMGCPIITSNVSSMPEVTGQGAVLINPKNIEEIMEAMYRIIKDEQFKKDLIVKGYANAKRFSWSKCAKETLRILTNL